MSFLWIRHEIIYKGNIFALLKPDLSYVYYYRCCVKNFSNSSSVLGNFVPSS